MLCIVLSLKSDVQVERVPEALNEGDGSTSSPEDSAVSARPAAQRAGCSLHKYVEDIPDQPCIIRQAMAQGIRKREPSLLVGRSELNPVAGGELPLGFAIDADSLQASRIAGNLLTAATQNGR